MLKDSSNLDFLDDVLYQSTPGPVREVTIGKVVDTNDPQQMGRIRAFCPGLTDHSELYIEQIPWCIYVSPLGGIVNTGKRGSEEANVDGPTAYGMWNIPKIGAYVLVGCIDGDESLRYYSGCIHPQYMTHTMPHGRFMWQGDSNGDTPSGPLDTYENPIEPTYTKQSKQFTKTEGTYTSYPPSTPSNPRHNMEWRSRGADFNASAITNVHIEHASDGPGSLAKDHAFGESISVHNEDGRKTTEIKSSGYGIHQQFPEEVCSSTGGINYDSHNYSWTTPGFHSISMNDRHENARIRLRTTSGHQILMDDTNERIYINTAGGESYIEIDSVGNIDIYASKNISTHAGGDINFTTDKSFRVQAKEGIHFRTDDEVRMHADKDINIRTEQNYRSHSLQKTYIESDDDMHIQSDTASLFVEFQTNINMTSHGSMLVLSDNNIDVKSGAATSMEQGSTLDINTSGEAKWTSGADMHHKSGGVYNQQSGGLMNLKSGANMQLSASPEIHLNGPPASPATPAGSSTDASPAEPAMETHSFWTNRVPEHEPWARVFMKDTADKDGVTVGAPANKHEPDYDYTSPDVGQKSTRVGALYNYVRGVLWRR